MNSCEFSFKVISFSFNNPYGAKRTRTADPLHAMQVLYQLSYGPLISKILVKEDKLIKLSINIVLNFNIHEKKLQNWCNNFL